MKKDDAKPATPKKASRLKALLYSPLAIGIGTTLLMLGGGFDGPKKPPNIGD